MRKLATVDNLNSVVEFDSPFEVESVGGFTFVNDSDDYSPTVMFTNAPGPDVDINSDDWEPVDGFSGQYGYPGPIMHPSEFLGGGMARYVLDNPGTYTITEVIDPEELEGESDPVGWILLRKKD